MTNYYISVSDIATLVDNNPYQDSDECLKKYRNRFFEGNSKTKQAELKMVVEKNLRSKGVSMGTFLNRVDATNSNEICKELAEVLVPDDSKKDSDYSDDDSPPATQADIKKYIRSEVYKHHGKKFESSVFEWLKTQLNGDLSESQKGKGMFLGEIDNRPWRIYGKIDGMHTTINGKKYIVEIKNRQNRIFTRIPLYEQIQVQMYMLIFGINDVILVQNHAGNHAMTYIKYDKALAQRTLKDLKSALGRIESL